MPLDTQAGNMKIKALIVSTVIGLILGGCSSPPPPVSPDFEEGTPDVVNATLPQWTESTGVIRSATDNSAWTYHTVFHSRSDKLTPEFYYATTHADRAIVRARDAKTWFYFRDWIKANSMAGTVVYQPYYDCMICDGVDITYIKNQKTNK